MSSVADPVAERVDPLLQLHDVWAYGRLPEAGVRLALLMRVKNLPGPIRPGFSGRARPRNIAPWLDRHQALLDQLDSSRLRIAKTDANATPVLIDEVDTRGCECVVQ